MDKLKPKYNHLWIPFAVAVLAVIGYFQYSQFADYQYMSDRHVADILLAKFWSIAWLLISFGIVYWKRRSAIAPALAVLAVSANFVVLYGILFRGTEYGMNGHWGDNGNRLAEICKMMYYGSFFQDWYLKDLPSFYPPGWFALMAVYAKVLGIEAYQTIKWGYLLIFLVYPWLLYFVWRKLVSPVAAAAVAVGTLFFAHRLIDWVYYEHMCAALFLPWWLYYFERVKQDDSLRRCDWKFYLAGAVYGGLMFMTYYYWFLMAAAVLPVTLTARYIKTRSFAEVGRDLLHKSVLMSGVAIVSAVYWVPLLRVIYWEGAESAQNVWFFVSQANLSLHWPSWSVEGIFIVIGIFLAFFNRKNAAIGRLLYLLLGGLLLVLIDRLTNLEQLTVQSRKVLEFAHVFMMAPLAIGAVLTWPRLDTIKGVTSGLCGLLLLASLLAANSHTEVYNTRYYEIAVGQRVPVADLKVFDSVDTKNAVIMTDHYRELCYLPYYLFIPYYNMTSHTAGRYSQREQFLDEAVKISEPDLLAYVLAHNRYSPVNFVYLPIEEGTGRWKLNLTQNQFNKPQAIVTRIFAGDHALSPELFVRRHERGLYEIVANWRTPELDGRVQKLYPDIYWHLQPRDW